MAERPDDNADGKKIEPEAAAAASGKSSSVDRNLPMVLAPRLDAAEDEVIDEASADPAAASGHGASAAPQPSPRFLALAASVAFAAAFASFVGSVSGSGLARMIYPPPVADTATQNASDTLRAMKQELAELAAIKAGLETTSRSTTSQFAKIADRLDRIDQRASAASETTGSIAAAAPPPAPSEPPKLTDRVLPDWVVQDVRYGRALVETSRGRLFEVGAGSVLPGLGRVAGIKRQDGQWVVLTESGTITSSGR